MPVYKGWLNPQPKVASRGKPRGYLYKDAITENPEAPPNPVDINYGLKAPEAPKKHWYDYLLQIGGPAALSMMNGTGAVPGAILGLMGMQAQKNAQYPLQQEAFNDERKFRQKDALERMQAGEEANYHKGMLEIGKTNAGANVTRANKPDSSTEIQKVAQAQARADAAIKMGQEPNPEDLNLIDLYESKLEQ